MPNPKFVPKLAITWENEHFYRGLRVFNAFFVLVCDSATLESLFRSNWPLRRSEAALNPEH